MSFYKGKKITETYLEFLIQSIQFKAKKTESTGGWKTSFPKESLENTDLHKPT